MKWKEIPNTNGLYLISSNGKVFSVRSNRCIKLQLNNVGYYRAEFNIDGIVKKESVHRLVAEAFIPNPNNYPLVNHKDENPRNNCVENLEWCTHKYNSNYGTAIKRRVQHTEYKLGAENSASKSVTQFTLDGTFVATYGGVAEAERETGVNGKDISKCALGKLKKACGYVWSYDGTFHYDEHKVYHIRNGNIEKYDMQGNYIKTYELLDELREDGLDPKSVLRVCRGERKSYKNFIFIQKTNA